MNSIGLFSADATVTSDITKTVTDVQNVVAGTAEADAAGSGRGILWRQTLRILWRQTLQHIHERPLFGFGPEGFYGDYALDQNLTPHNE